MSFTSMESEEQERKLFVGGLNKSLSDEEGLRNFFTQYGSIIDCTIMRDGDKQSRGFGFVLFEHATSVDDIIALKKEGKNFTLDDHHIEVKRALPKVPGGNAGSSRTGGLYRKIFVGGLPSTITDEDLRTYFERFGRVNEVELLRDRESNRLRGFAFVTFDDEDSADKCIQRRTHEICKKICEVKRAQTRSTLTKYEHDDGGRQRDNYHNSNYHHRDGGDRHGAHQASPSGGSLGMAEVNQLIQQAFVMGQQSVLQPSAMQPPTAASLLALTGSSGASFAAPPVNNALLQALISQQHAANQPPPAPIAPPQAAPANTGAINQLAQLLQGKIDPNALTALLKHEPDMRSGPKPANSGSYSTTYPPTSAYDLYYGQQNSSNYGSSKDESDSKRYRPY
ncbi:heterogeneous nuclear ribonucleoprotein A/B-like [Hydractinia symbiolongicarpus]|uniref:heterogeneous nuclear ribonucleoprotein A/B-like n=1 Tax=Hydractinia symbiolongicarpus TaxID=13093 RepID=UPI0025509BE9|nr:heterogeneous nuclear ribonucleoprotein A/B-like [Hydractinia symbiolongicarpus]